MSETTELIGRIAVIEANQEKALQEQERQGKMLDELSGLLLNNPKIGKKGIINTVADHELLYQSLKNFKTMATAISVAISAAFWGALKLYGELF